MMPASAQNVVFVHPPQIQSFRTDGPFKPSFVQQAGDASDSFRRQTWWTGRQTGWGRKVCWQRSLWAFDIPKAMAVTCSRRTGHHCLRPFGHWWGTPEGWWCHVLHSGWIVSWPWVILWGHTVSPKSWKDTRMKIWQKRPMLCGTVVETNEHFRSWCFVVRSPSKAFVHVDTNKKVKTSYGPCIEARSNTQKRGATNCYF